MDPAILPIGLPTAATPVPIVVAPRDASVATRRVLHVINGEHYSGAERVQDLLALRLPAEGFAASFACIKPGLFATTRKSLDAPLFELPMRHRFDFGVVDELVELMDFENFELVHSHTPRTALVGGLAARRADVPFVYHVHSPVLRDSTRRLQNLANGMVERWSVRGADRLICVSPSLQQYMLGRGGRSEAVKCVPNGVPAIADAIDRTPPLGTWTLGVVALFRPRKGLEVLLEALAAMLSRDVNVRLLAIGAFETAGYEGAIRSQVERLELGDAIEWTGFTIDVAAELRRVDLLVLPSLFGEGLPMVVLEAMAAGVPVVASRVAGVPEAVVHRETGLLVDPGSVSQLATGIEAVVAGKVDYAALSRQARQRHRDLFSDRSMAAAVAAVYRELLDD
jgi:glycosyltransferase involved in cell wall biosynthesis